jgi:hypothetical protein
LYFYESDLMRARQTITSPRHLAVTVGDRRMGQRSHRN